VGTDFGDRADSENADRDFITSLDAMVIKAADGRVVWDMNWEFLDASWGFSPRARPMACGHRR
jgi:alkyl sulfatase BDS1-like metallo-beta-lactamase superfamily hydrolase